MDLDLDHATPREILLADYQPPAFTTEKCQLEFNLNPGTTTVKNTLSVRALGQDANEIYLDGEHLELVSIAVDGRSLSDNEYAVDDEGLIVRGLSDRHEIEVVTRIHPEENTALEGLYRSSQMYCTQCEAQGFRRITYYQDRPDVLARFTTAIEADAAEYPTLLANGNLVAEEVVAEGRKRVVWEDPFPKPSYLFALVAGNLHVLEDQFVTMSGRRVALKIYSEAHNIGQCGYAMDVLKRSMTWDEERFGREYDLDIFMIVAVEDFNMGAMENKGLNIFNTSCVLASPDTATDQAHQRVEAVVAHEYFHNWSGNRVTCRDWFQLSLKEGFTVYRDAEFSGDMNSKSVKRIEDVAFLRSVQFAEDASPLAHPVRPQSYIEISNFYTTTIYEKGAELVRMYDTLLGPEKFRAGTDLYFDRYDGQAVTTDDFAATMAEVGGRDLTQFKRWYDQAGTPELVVEESFADGELLISISQSCPPTRGQSTKDPFHIPVLMGLLDEGGEAIPAYEWVVDCSAQTKVRDGGGSLLLELTEPVTELRLGYFESKPYVSFLRAFSAPVKVQYERSSNELAYLAMHDTDGFVAWDALQTLWLDLFAGRDGSDPMLVLGRVAERALEVSTTEEKQLAAMMLAVPDINYLFEGLTSFEVDALLDARNNAIEQIARDNFTTWQRLYESLRPRERYEPTPEAMADRALANQAFAYLCRNLSGDALVTQVVKHFDDADNLTDRRAALSVAINHPQFDPATRAQLLTRFHTSWRHEALVIDLWFGLQAQSEQTSIENLEQLIRHEDFDLKNPNRARSVIAVFGMQNHRHFHALDGSGYEVLAKYVAEVDDLNPQLAARLATPLTRWQRYDERRQGLMKQALHRLSELSGISKDLYEIVTKALD